MIGLYFIAKNPDERMSRQAIETLNEVKVDVKHGDMIHAFNRQHITDGICPTLTTRPEGFKTASLVVENIYEKESDSLANINRNSYDFMPFTYVSLFSGIGGFEQALNKLGGTCVFASEIDKFAAQAYETLYGEAPAGDITQIDAKDIPKHDLLVGGFPCQAFSVAGRRQGFEDTRGTLFFEIARIAKEKRPKALLLENVKGLVNHDKGRTLYVMIETLNEIGYVVDFDVLNSKYFGVPQNRERIFIVAIREDLIEAEPFSEESTTGQTIVPKGKRRIGEWTKTFNFDWPEQAEVTTRLRDILESIVDEKYYLDEDKTSKLVAQLEERDKPQVLRPQRTEYGKAIRKQYEAGEIEESRHNMTELQHYDHVAEEVLPVLTPDRVEKRQNGRRFKEDGEESFTLTSQDRHGVALGNPPKYRIRKLTPRECFRLQNFPDEAFNKLKDAGISDSQLYKMSGNAVTTSVVEAIAERLVPIIVDGDTSSEK